MPVARFQMDDGRIARFEVPEGTTPEQAQSMMQEHFTPQQEQVQQPTEGHGRFSSTMAGIGQGVGTVGLGAQELIGHGLHKIGSLASPGKTLGDLINPRQGLLESAGQWLINDAEQGRRNMAGEVKPYEQDHPNYVTGGKIAGEIAATLPVGGILGKGVEAVSTTPKALALAQAIKTGGIGGGAIKGASDLATRMAGGTITGGATSALIDPESAGTGAAIGAFLPPGFAIVGGTLKYVGNAAKSIVHAADEAVISGGVRRSSERILNELAGDKTKQLQEALKNAPADLTAGQATREVSRPQIAALQDFAKSELPDEFRAIKDAQEAARMALLKGVTPDLQAAEAARTSAASPLYEAARNAGNVVNTAPIANKIDDLLAKNPGNKELVRELSQIKSGLYDSTGELRVNSEQVASVLDGLKAQMANKENKFIQGNLNEIKNDLVKAIPNMEQAQAKFAEMSPPVNQSKVLTAMQDVLKKPGGGERRTPFLNVLGTGEQALIKKNTGMPRYQDGDLTKILSQPQNEVVNKISSQLEGQARDEVLSEDGRKAFNKIVTAGENVPTIPTLWNAIVSVANSVIRKLGAKGSADVNKDLAFLTLPENKQLLAEVLAKSETKDRVLLKKAIENFIKKPAAKTSVVIPANTREEKRNRLSDLSK